MFMILSISQRGISGDEEVDVISEVHVISEHTDELSECSGFCGRTTAGDAGEDEITATDCDGVSLHAKLGIFNASEHGVKSPLDNILVLCITGSNDTAKGSRECSLVSTSSYLACSMSLVCEF